MVPGVGTGVGAGVGSGEGTGVGSEFRYIGLVMLKIQMKKTYTRN